MCVLWDTKWLCLVRGLFRFDNNVNIVVNYNTVSYNAFCSMPWVQCKPSADAVRTQQVSAIALSAFVSEGPLTKVAHFVMIN